MLAIFSDREKFLQETSGPGEWLGRMESMLGDADSVAQQGVI